MPGLLTCVSGRFEGDGRQDLGRDGTETIYETDPHALCCLLERTEESDRLPARPTRGNLDGRGSLEL